MTLCNEYEHVWDWQKSRMMNLHCFSLLPDWPPRPSALHNNKQLLRLCTRNDHTNYIMYQNNEQSVLQCCYGNACYVVEGCSKFFHVENAIFARKKFFRQTLANPMFIFSGACWPRLVRRTWMCDILKFVPGVWSLVTLHSVAAALKHLRSALRCWSLLTFIGQFWHNKSTVWAT